MVFLVRDEVLVLSRIVDLNADAILVFEGDRALYILTDAGRGDAYDDKRN
jgi:hypothetical protein